MNLIYISFFGNLHKSHVEISFVNITNNCNGIIYIYLLVLIDDKNCALFRKKRYGCIDEIYFFSPNRPFAIS